MTRFDAAIIDLDGTLVDTLGDFEAAIGRMLAELGLAPVDRAFIEHTIGRGGEHLIRNTLARAGGDAALYPRAWSSYQAHYGAVNGDFSAVYPGAREGVERLAAAGLALACVTNKPYGFAQALLERKALRAPFAQVYGGDSFVRKKPDPLPLLEACKALGSVPARTLMIGDSSNDAAAARAAGCPVVLVRYGYNHGEPIDRCDAEAFVDRLDEVPARLLATLGRP
ncbi:MAG TPA: phosphoglycolate phosphatase [Burkholderiaceae bacterium]|nr:phosphoglycolate phosphatase [Burkholderiaceae bacterium]